MTNYALYSFVFFFLSRFEIAIFVLIFLNMLTMGIEHYDQPRAIFFILEVSNAFFTTVFSLGLYYMPIFCFYSFNCFFLSWFSYYCSFFTSFNIIN